MILKTHYSETNRLKHGKTRINNRLYNSDIWESYIALYLNLLSDMATHSLKNGVQYNFVHLHGS